MEISLSFVEPFKIALLAPLAFFVYGFASVVRLLVIANRKIDVDLEISDIFTKTTIRGCNIWTFYYPEFRIISGPYKSIACKSRIGVYPRPHEIGEITKGLYDPKKNTIVSIKIYRRHYLISVLCAVFGGILFWIFWDF